MKPMKIEKSIITSVRTDCEFDTRCLTEHTKDLNDMMERKFRISEEKIARGLASARWMLVR